MSWLSPQNRRTDGQVGGRLLWHEAPYTLSSGPSHGYPSYLLASMISCMVMHEQPHVIDDEDDEELELTACLQLSCNLPELLDAFYIYFYYQEFFQLLQEQIKTSSSSFCAQIPMDELFQEATARLQPGQIIPSFIIRRALTSNGKDDGISIPEVSSSPARSMRWSTHKIWWACQRLVGHIQVMLRLLKDVDLANTLKERKQKDLPTITSGINSKSKQDEDVKALFAQYYDRLTADTEGVKAPHEKQKRSKKPSSRWYFQVA